MTNQARTALSGNREQVGLRASVLPSRSRALFVVPPLGGFASQPPKGGTTNSARLRVGLSWHHWSLVIVTLVLGAGAADAGPRARDLGIPFDGTPGRFNAITDVAGVEVGHTTLISGHGKLVIGVGPIRSGVTALWPRG